MCVCLKPFLSAISHSPPQWLVPKFVAVVLHLSNLHLTSLEYLHGPWVKNAALDTQHLLHVHDSHEEDCGSGSWGVISSCFQVPTEPRSFQGVSLILQDFPNSPHSHTKGKEPPRLQASWNHRVRQQRSIVLVQVPYILCPLQQKYSSQASLKSPMWFRNLPLLMS